MVYLFRLFFFQSLQGWQGLQGTIIFFDLLLLVLLLLLLLLLLLWLLLLLLVARLKIGDLCF